LIEKYEGQITDIRKWDERRLAYEIAGKNRGLYILVYFEIPTAMLQEIERDIQLSEDILRAMILRTDQMSEEDLKRETPAMAESRAATEQREASEISDQGSSSEDNDDDSKDSDDRD
jgi:small subunit ribosomal protein S6